MFRGVWNKQRDVLGGGEIKLQKRRGGHFRRLRYNIFRLVGIFKQNYQSNKAAWH